MSGSHADLDPYRFTTATTGEVEVLGLELTVLNVAETPPFQLEDTDIGEETRLRYRYIDLRRPEMQERIRLRARMDEWLKD